MAGAFAGIIRRLAIVLLAMLRALRWHQLLGMAGFAVLVSTTGRLASVWTAHLLALHGSGMALTARNFGFLADPLDWLLVIIGVVFYRRARRLASDAREILPRENLSDVTGPKVPVYSLHAMTWGYAFLFLGTIALERYETSAYLLQPGVDARSEQRAMIACNQGATLAEAGEWSAAEDSFQQSLRLWEKLAENPAAPLHHRTNLADTLHYLAWICWQQDRLTDAEVYYSRVVEIADALGDNSGLTEEFRQQTAEAREVLEGLRADKSDLLLSEKDREADRKFEEARVKDQRAATEAEGLYREAIALWEELLSQATNEAYRAYAIGQLATAYQLLGELHLRREKSSEAQLSLERGIDYGQQALALDPQRPLWKHNLQVTRDLLAHLHLRTLGEEIERLCKEQRFADVLDRYRQMTLHLEQQADQALDRDEARE